MTALSQCQQVTGSLSSEGGKIKSLGVKGNKAHTVDTGNTALKNEAMRKECRDCLAFSRNLASRRQQPSMDPPGRSSGFLGNLISLRENRKDTNMIVLQGHSPAKQSTVRITSQASAGPTGS